MTLSYAKPTHGSIIKYIFSLCLTLFAINSYGISGQRFFTFKSSQGLSDNTVYCALKDRYGFMWFGTGDGLNCFDGILNQVLRNDAVGNAPKNSSVYSILEVGDDIWAGGNNGITIFNRRDGSISHFNVRTKYSVLVRSSINNLVKGKDNRIWIATSGQGYFIYDTKSGSLTQDSRHGGFIEDMLVDKQGRVWQINIDGRLNVYNSFGKYLFSTTIPSFTNMKQTLCLGMAANRLWVGCSQGLYRYDHKSNKLVKVAFKSQIPSDNISSILSYGANRLLLGTDHGLMAYNTRTGECGIMPEFSQLSDGSIRSLLRDKSGTLWVMTDNDGVCYLPAITNQFSFVSLPIDNVNLLVHAFATTADGRMWIGSSHGLYSYNGSLMPTSINGNIQTLLAVGNTLYVGSRQYGLTVIGNGGTKTFTYSPNIPYSLTSNNVQCLLKSHDNQIYVGTNWGICRFDQKTQSFYGYQISSMTSILSLAEDRKGRIWCATATNGLVRISPKDKAIVTYTNNSNIFSLPSNNVISVKCDKNGRLWIATANGLCYYDEKHDNFHTVSVKSFAINFISDETNGNLWMAADNGLLRYNIATGRQTLFDNLPEGWNANDARNSVFCSRSGEIYVGADGGFYHFNPSRLGNYTQNRHFYVTTISFPWAVNSEKEAKRLGVGGQLYITKEVTLPYSDNSFTLNLASPNYGSFSHPQFEYQLKGYDRNWIKESNHEVSYSHVPPGSYTFLLRQADGSIVTSLKIDILPPWYRTIWAYLCYILAVAAALWLLLRWNRKTVRKKYEVRMEQYKAQQEKQVFQSKISFFVDLVHEIRTPLSLISLPLQLLEDNPTKDDAKRYIGIIHKNVNYLFSVTNHLLDFQKMENGKLELKFKNTDVNNVVKEMYEQFADYDDVRQITLTFDEPDKQIVTAMDEDMIKKVLMNLLSNAQKYAKSHIILRLERLDENNLRISVIDDGKGVPDSDKENIFDAYYQAKGDKLAQKMGTGLGLAFAKGIAEEHGGKLYVVDAPGGGSEFRLELPIKTVSAKQANAGNKDIDTTPHVGDEQQKNEDEGNNADTKKFTLMMVEDNADLLNLTASQLRKWYRIVTAKNGVEALQQLKNNNVDLIVSDVMMPEMDGIELCRHIKQNINYSHIPVILLTAKTMVQAKEEGLEVGADVYLEKPFSIRQLHLQINNLLAMRQQFYERMQNLAKEKAPAKKNNDLGLSNDDYKFMKAMNEYLDANLANEDFSIDDLADKLNMSRSSFYRKLKALTDMSPVDYTKHYRLDSAARMLREGKRVTEVLTDVGFTSSSYFAKCFKNQFGVLPKDYVKSLK